MREAGYADVHLLQHALKGLYAVHVARLSMEF